MKIEVIETGRRVGKGARALDGPISRKMINGVGNLREVADKLPSEERETVNAIARNYADLAEQVDALETHVPHPQS